VMWKVSTMNSYQKYMSLLFETIRISNGVPQHLDWHQRRMSRSMQEIWGETESPDLASRISVPAAFARGLVRCNVYYGRDIREINFHHYDKRIIRSLKMVESTTIDYHLKYFDRTRLEGLFSLRGECDEILIVKDGLVSDTSMSNLIFQDGQRWVTPAKPLLKGTCRERLLSEGYLIEMDIPATGISRFSGCKLINAMRDPEEEELIPVSEIRP
jgi:4-amino-4-deoxychorismate lyase